MFGFQLGIVHISKDIVYNDNNNAFRIVYQVSITTTQGLEWSFNTGKFSIIGENFPNIVLTLSITS
jgi:hypothetical protein